MAQVIRPCAGGVVFNGDDVFLLMSDKGDWVMPKGVIRSRNRSNEVALWRVEDEAGIHAHIIGIAGNTAYDFFSESRQKDVSNRVQWFVMEADDDAFHIAFDQGFLNGGYFPYEKALTVLTHENDVEILKAAHAIYMQGRE